MDARSASAPFKSRKDRLSLLPFLALFFLLALLTLNLPFFWDKDILYSRLGHWLLLHNFNAVIPDDLDPGYPPALAYLLAASWKIAGTTLPVMHLLMLPFTLGIIWQTHKLLHQFLPQEKMTMAMVLMLASPVFLSQTVVYSTDLAMLFFMLLALNSLLLNRKWWLAVAVPGLFFCHMRGIMVAMTLGVFDLYRHARWNKPVSAIQRLPPYLPGLALFAAWAFFHFHTKGWIFYHAASPWAGCYVPVNGAGFLKNCIIVLWRLMDFGHVMVWITVGILLLPRFRQKGNVKESLGSILFLLGFSLLVTLPPMLYYKMLNGHRYLIPVYYFLSLLASFLLFASPERAKLKKVLAVVSVAALLSGNFWVYPDKIAKGWDSSLAHLPYHTLRHKMIQYIDQNRIPVSETGSRTPNTSIFGYIELNGDPRAFPEADLARDHYVFYSNVINIFTDEEIDRLKHVWIVVKEYRCLQVRVTLYRNPEWRGEVEKAGRPAIRQFGNDGIFFIFPVTLSPLDRPTPESG
jgi:hypothetical protein